MSNNTRLLPRGIDRLTLTLLMIFGLSLGARAQEEAAAPDSGAAPAAVLIPVNAGDTATTAPAEIAIPAATAISNPALEPSVAPAPTLNANEALPLPPPPVAPVEAAAPATSESAETVLTPYPGAEAFGAAEGQGADGSTALKSAQSADAQHKAPYLTDLKPIEIFDASKMDETTPLQRVAHTLAERREARVRHSLAHIQNLATYEYDLEGPSEQKIALEASTQALLSAAGRLYFEDCLIVGLDLLEPYLRENGRPFIARTSVLSHRPVPGGRLAMRVRVSVNLDALYKDLEAKHFLAHPNPRPTIAVFLQEIANGERNTASGGRARIERTMEQNLFQVFSDKVRQPALDADVSAAPGLLKTARMEAQRNNADIIIAGSLVLQPANQQQVYYDQYAFKEAELTLKMIRVDTGEQIGMVRDRYSAVASNEEGSTQKLLDAMIVRATQKLADELNRMWPNTMLLQDNYRLMVSGVDESGVASVCNMLQTLSPRVSVFRKSYLGNVLVVNVVAPDVTPEKLEAFLRESNEPQFTVTRVDKRRLSLSVM